MATSNVKWKEIFSLIALNFSVVISWIAYHEYQPVLLKEFGLLDLANFTMIGKAVILVVIPPFSGFLADKLLKSNSNFFLIYTIGIVLTGITFMIVASIIGAGPLSTFVSILPIMIVIWLISMNIFYSPANSMVEKFAPEVDLPLVIGVIFVTTEIGYALEPIVVALVTFLGPVLTFVAGGVLITGSGYLFYKNCFDEIQERSEDVKQKEIKATNTSGALLLTIGAGLLAGFAHTFMNLIIQNRINGEEGYGIEGSTVSLSFLLLAAVLFLPAIFITRNIGTGKVVTISAIVIAIIAPISIFLNTIPNTFIFGGILAIAYAMLSVSAIPKVLTMIDRKYITFAFGIYFGSIEIISGFVELYYEGLI